MHFCIAFCLLAFLGCVQALSTAGNRLLVVLEDEAEKAKYSKFIGDLSSRGFSITYETPKSSSLKLFQHEARAYDHVVLLPTKVKSSLAAKDLLNFVKDEGNIIVALSSEIATPSVISTFLLETEINLPSDRTSVVVDHFNYDLSSAAEKHDVVLIPSAGPSQSSLKNFFKKEGVVAVPRGVAQVLGNSSPLLMPILKASDTAYSYNPQEEANAAEDPFAIGEQISLVSSLQARNSARCVVVGSAEMLQDSWFDTTVKSDKGKLKTANREFAKALSAWTFKEIGVLKVGKLQHFATESTDKRSRSNSTETNPDIYRIKTPVAFEIELSEYDMTHQTPFNPPGDDEIQLEFSMLSPFHRLVLKPVRQTATSTIYGTSFVLPDQHGIFNFRVNYKRPFLTIIDEKHQVTVRHFAHDEWPRSWTIPGAWTSVAAIWTVVGGWLCFVAVWLWSAPRGQQQAGLKKRQ